MKILVITDFKAYSVKGVLYIGTQFSSIAKRYRLNLGELTLISRVVEVERAPVGTEAASAYVSNFIPVPSLKFVFTSKYKKVLEKSLECTDLVVFRCPSIIAQESFSLVQKFNLKYMVELMGDAWDAYWNHGLLGKFLAPYVYFMMRRIVAKSDYALYVTEYFLQKRYPSYGISTHASNVLLPEVSAGIVERRISRIRSMHSDRVTLMTIGAVDVQYKGQEFVIRAIPILNKKNIRVKYYLVGGGDSSRLSRIAEKLDVVDQVIFCGRKERNFIMSLLDDIDIYIQPSLQEGLPRSLIEALSRACPVIGANTAGIPELIDNKYVVDRKDAVGIADLICFIISLSQFEKEELIKKNFEKSKDYLYDTLEKRRSSLFKKIINDFENYG